MTAADVLQGVTRLGLDSAPIIYFVIYFVEGNPQFYRHCLPFFEEMDRGTIEGFTSTLVLPETLVHPLRSNDTIRTAAFRNLLLATSYITTVPLTTVIVERAAQFRADYNLRTPDAIQLATAIASRCEVFLTNDGKLARVQDVRVIVVHELAV